MSPQSRMLTLAVLGTLALSGCDTLKNTVLDKKDPPPCPPIYILADAGKVTKYRDGPGRDLTDVEAEGEILGYKGDCSYDETGANVSVQVRLGVKRGPADTDRKTELDYFVAIPYFYPSPDAKAVFPVTIAFPEGSNYVKYDDEFVTMHVPVKDGAVIQNYEIYLGFQTTPEELDRNRRTR